jgi:predicted Rdx family selenoprotein
MKRNPFLDRLTPDDLRMRKRYSSLLRALADAIDESANTPATFGSVMLITVSTDHTWDLFSWGQAREPAVTQTVLRNVIQSVDEHLSSKAPN